MRFRIGILLCLTARLAGAHEIGTTRVTARFPGDGTYEVAIVTDATALLEKLSAVTGKTGELASFDTVFRGRVALAFDGVGAQPSIAYAVTPESNPGEAPAATIRLTGRIPAEAGAFTWRYGWTFASYAMTVAGGETVWLEGGQRSEAIPVATGAMPEGRWPVAWRYLALGFTHILPHGLDHMLFVLGIYLLNSRARPVLMQVTAFTAAHSITLGLGMYGLLPVPPRIVEPLIAISIAYVAIENLFLSELKPWRMALVFAFGLLHGMGFAGVLTEVGLPRTEYLTALLTFNLGVEAGQLAVIGTAVVLVGWRWGSRVWYRNRVVQPASVAIACVALYWTVERLAIR